METAIAKNCHVCGNKTPRFCTLEDDLYSANLFIIKVVDHYACNVCKHRNVQHNSLLVKNNSNAWFFMLFIIKSNDYHKCYHDKSLK
jgi:hypothetical protein